MQNTAHSYSLSPCMKLILEGKHARPQPKQVALPYSFGAHRVSYQSLKDINPVGIQRALPREPSFD